MKIVIDETYDYAYNVWTYERGYVYDVEEVPRSGFYHYWHGANLDVIPHGNAHPASAKEIRSLPSGEALHKGEKTVTVSMDSILHHRDDETAMSGAESVSRTPSRRKAKTSSKAKKTPSEAKSASGKASSGKKASPSRASAAGRRKPSAGTKKAAPKPSGKATAKPAGRKTASGKTAKSKAASSPSAGKKTAGRRHTSSGSKKEPAVR